MRSRVKWFKDEKGYGFIKYTDKEDIFIHYSSIIRDGFKSLKKDDEHFLFDENCLDPEYLQNMLSTGQWLLQQSSSAENEENDIEWKEITWQSSSQIVEVYDTSDDAAAESEYESAMADIQKKDKIFELRLQQVETEEKAVEKELDSVKDVIKQNIDDSYKTFA